MSENNNTEWFRENTAAYKHYWIYNNVYVTVNRQAFTKKCITESVHSIVGMSEMLRRRNTLQTLEYLALGTLSHILNTTILFYG